MVILMKLKFKDIDKLELPRERLIRLGVKNLSTLELLAILLRTGNNQEDVLELSKRLLIKLEKLRKENSLTYQNLSKIKGIKKAKATTLLAAIEFGRRYNKKLYNINEIEIIKSPKDVYNLLKDTMATLDHEEVACIYLDVKSRVIKTEIIYKGTINNVSIHPREIFKNAFKLSAYGFILIHNHPSGDVNPSLQDINATKEIIKASKIVKLLFVDHMIISKNKIHSIFNDLTINIL